MRNKIEIESIWEDDNLFEICIYASNTMFSASANCYTTRSRISEFSKSLSGFPKSLKDEVVLSTIENEDFSYFKCIFYPSHKTGHFKVKVTIANIITYHDHKENGMAEFEFYIEPSAIDNFVRSLDLLSGAAIGEIKAVLNGKT